VEAVVGAQRVLGGGASGSLDQWVGHNVDLQFTPEVVQVIERRSVCLARQPATLSHPGKGRCRLEAGDGTRRGRRKVVVGLVGEVAVRLVDEQLDQRARIEVEAQRRPSET
jgi:hypothetical protein